MQLVVASIQKRQLREPIYYNSLPVPSPLVLYRPKTELQHLYIQENSKRKTVYSLKEDCGLNIK